MDGKKKPCIVAACRNQRFDLVHRFPMRGDRAEIWRKILKIEEINRLDIVDVRKRFFVCSRHFLPSDYKNTESRGLNWNAVPSINLTTFDNPNCMDSCTYDTAEAQKSTPAAAKDTPPACPAQETTAPSPPPKPKTIPPKETLSPVIQMVHKKKAATPLTPLKKVVKVRQQAKGTMLVSASQLNSLLQSMVEQRAQVAVGEPDHLRNASTSSLGRRTVKVLRKVPGVDRVEEVLMLDTDEDGEEPFAVSSQSTDDVKMKQELQDEHFITVPGIETPLDSFWLRDHCRCSKCYNESTYQRRVSIRQIPLNVRATSAKVTGDQLTVEWPDGHLSTYSIEYLATALLPHRLATKPTAFTWNRDTIQRFSYARVTMNEYLQDEQVSRAVVQSLVDYGVAFVEKVPANCTFTEIVIKRLFNLHRTHFGELWKFSDNTTGFQDTAYTAETLPSHTDNTYFNDASGLQVLHCIEYEATGGLSSLVDGFKVLENLKAKHPQVYERLKRYQVPAEYKDAETHHTHTAPIVTEDAVDGSFQQIRYNIADRSPLNTLPMSEMRNFYGDLQKLAEEVEDTANEWWFQLKPGTVMFFNNWRLLHGRSSFSGKRVMCGSYVSRTEFMSVARTLKIVP